MVLFTGSAANSWFIYTPSFFWSNLDWYSHSFLAFRFLIKQEFFKKKCRIFLWRKDRLMQEFTNPFPLTSSSLIHCITNEISCEMLANEFWLWDLNLSWQMIPVRFLILPTPSFINLGHLL